MDTVELNLQKLEAVWTRLEQLIPTGTIFVNGDEYEKESFHFRKIAESLPPIGDFRVNSRLLSYNEIAQMTFDAHEVGDLYAHIAVSEAVGEPGRDLREYRLLLESKRRGLVQNRKSELCASINTCLSSLLAETSAMADNEVVNSDDFDRLKELFDELDLLLGKGRRPSKWQTLRRHLDFRQAQDIRDIAKVDWPSLQQSLDALIYHETDALPVDVENLNELTDGQSSGVIPTGLDWSVLTDEGFERLIFSLIASTEGYQNPRWLQKTRASDQGRDLSVELVETDLSGTRVRRIILQCRHRQSSSVTLNDVKLLESQMELWEPPAIDCLIIVTSGRFVREAISYIEKHNLNERMRIDMWPESHLEMLLASRPDLVVEFGLPRIAKGKGRG